MNKQHLLQQILATLEAVSQSAFNAAQRAYETATDSENEAENKYDTMGLEASYLAHGQQQRVLECENDLLQFTTLLTQLSEQPSHKQLSDNRKINLGDLIQLEDENTRQKYLFLSPVAGGLRLIVEHQEINLITPLSPIGQALVGQQRGDEIAIIIANEKKHYAIISIQ